MRTSWAAQGKTGEAIVAELRLRDLQLVLRLRGMDNYAAKELKELREQNARLKRPLAEATVKDALREVARGKF